MEKHSGGTKRAGKEADSLGRTLGTGCDGGGAEQVWREMRLGRDTGGERSKKQHENPENK